MTISFEIDGQRSLALNGGPQFKFTPALSLIVNCDDQAEIDALWEKLAEGGSHQQCGWLTDKFGVSWQIVPRALPEFLSGRDAEADGSLHAGGDDDEEARHRPIAAGVRAELKAQRSTGRRAELKEESHDQPVRLERARQVHLVRSDVERPFRRREVLFQGRRLDDRPQHHERPALFAAAGRRDEWSAA